MTQSILPAFSTGVISPELVSSTELEKQRYALKESNNMIIDALGGAKNRPGTQYRADAYDTTIASRLIPFQFNTEQAYMLEFSNLKFRILKDGGLVGAPTVVTTQYTTAEIPDITFTQSADVLYIFHPDHKIGVITRTSDTAWTFNAAVAIFPSWPYKPRAENDANITINAKFISAHILGDIWEFTASSAIFDDVELSEPFRLGFSVPNDLTAIHWVDFVVNTLTSTTVIRGRASLPTGHELTYQQILNSDFSNGIVFWDEHSAVTSSLSYDETTGDALLTDSGGAPAIMQQIVSTSANRRHIIRVTTGAFTGTTPTLTLNVGTTPLGTELISASALTASGTFTLDLVPTAETIYVWFDTTGSGAATMLIEEVRLSISDTKVAVTREQNTNEWRLSAWNSTHGFPSVGIINEQRLIVGNTATLPQTIWPSKVGGFDETGGDFRFNTPTLETDSFAFKPPTVERNGIDWFILQSGLKVGTSSGIWTVFATSGGIITPTDVNINIDGSVGTLDLEPLPIGNSILLAPRGMSAVSEITSSFETSGFVPRDVTILARHLFEDRRIVRWAFAKNPDSVVWCVLDDGTLLSFTYVREYDIWAWSKHTTPLGEGFKDVAVIPNSSDDNIDDVYFVINRGGIETTLGAFPNNYYIEQLNKRITSQTAAFGLSASGTPYDYRFLDSALNLDAPQTITDITTGVGSTPMVATSTGHSFLDGEEVRIQNVIGVSNPSTGVSAVNNVVFVVTNKAANTFELYDSAGSPVSGVFESTYKEGGEARKMVTAITGLDHLDDQVVTALADGAVMPNLTVTSGAITLPTAASYAHVGIPYVSDIETIDLEVSGDQGSTQGRLKSATKATVYFKETRGAEFQTASATDSTWWPMSFDSEEFGENPPGLLTGTKEISLSGNYREQERLKIRQTEPLPIHIKRIIPDVDYSG